ncbi:hypothetical protein ACM1ZW_19535 [Pseudomonas sp. NFX71]|uniref:hypothetical protein n=1 Tax=Pseudomonas sp. NFX71 TaxID=3399121 RepID=UPI003A83E5F6
MRLTVIASLAALALSGCVPPQRIDAARLAQRPGPETFSLLSSNPLNGSATEVENGLSLIDKITAGGGEKNEYESSGEYNRRISELIPEALSFQLKLDRSLISYDADTGLLAVSVALDDAANKGYQGSGSSAGAQKTYPALLMGGSVKINGQYQGQNAFGASATVSQVSAKKVFVVLGEVSGSIGVVSNISGKAAIPSATMKSIANDLALRIDGRSAAPYFTTSADFQEATIYTKQQTSSRLYFLRLDPVRVSLINTKTGAVYAGDIKMTVTRY